MKRIYVLLLTMVLGVLLLPIGWVSLGAPKNSGSWLRHVLKQQPQDAPARLIPLDQIDTLPLAETSNDPARRDPRRWQARLNENNLRQQEIFPGVDLVFAGNKQKMEAVLIVKAGADLNALRFDFPLAESVTADAQGNIWVIAVDGDLGLLRPRLTRQNETVEGGFVAKGGRVSLQVKEHDATQPLLVRFDVVYPTRPVNLLDQFLFRVFTPEVRPNTPNAPSAATITATKTVDNPTTTPGGTLMYTVTITNTSPTDAATGVKFTDTIDPNTTLIGSSVNTSPIANDDSTYTCSGNIPISPATGVLSNDCDPNNTGSGMPCDNTGLKVSQVNATAVPVGVPTTVNTTATGLGGVTGSVTMNDNGSFTYEPPPGYIGNDSFTYIATDAGGKTSAAATVTIAISNMVWFINNNAGGSLNRGTFTHPFTTIASFNTVNDTGVAPKPQNGHFIALRTGTGTYSETNGVNLRGTQKLIGEGVQFNTEFTADASSTSAYTTFASNASGTRPVVGATGAGNNGVSLNSGNKVRGLNAGTTTSSGFGIANQNTVSIGDLIISNVLINNSAGGGFKAVNGGGNINVTLDSLTSGDNDASNDGANGINLESITSGSFTVSGAVTISDTTGVGIRLFSLGSTTFTISGTTTINNPGDIGISSFSGTGTVSFAGIDINGRNNKGMRIDNQNRTLTTGAVDIDNADTVAFSALEIINTAGGTISFGSFTANLNTASSFGIESQNNTAAISFGSGSSVSNSGAVEILVNLGGANFTYNGTVNSTVGGAIKVVGRTGGTVDFQGNITSTNPSNNATHTAIIVGGAAAEANTGGTVRFSGGTKTLNSSTATAVSAVNNTGAIVEFTNGGLDIDTTSGTGFSATNGGTINITTGASNNTINSTSAAAFVADGTSNAIALTATFNSVTSGGGTNGIALTNVTGASNFGSGSLTGASGATFLASGNNPAITYSGTITQNNAARVVDIQGTTGNTITLSGTITGGASSTGIHIGDTTAVNGSVSFTTLNLGTSGSRMTNQAVTITNGGSSATYSLGAVSIFTSNAEGIVATNADGTLNSTSGTVDAANRKAININGPAGLTTLGMTLTKVTSTSSTSNGIFVQDTSGSFTVTGDGGGSNNGSGGTISSATNVGVSLNNVSNISLGYLNVQSSGDAGIQGFSVTNFTLNRSNVTSNGNSTSDEGIQFGLFSGNTVGVTGTATITNCDVSSNAHNNVHFRSTSGTLDLLTVTNSTFNNINDTNGANSFLYEASGTSVTTEANVTGCSFNGNSPQRGLEVQTHDTARIGNTSVVPAKYFVISGSTFMHNGIHASFTQDTSSDLAFKLLSSNFQFTETPSNSGLQAINIFSSSASTGGSITGTVSSNTIGTAGTCDSGSQTGSGIRLAVQAKTAGKFLIDGNTIRETHNARGIDAQFLGTIAAAQTVPTSDITITNNDVNHVHLTCHPGSSNFPLAAIFLAADNQGSPSTVRAQITGNTVPTAASAGTGSYDYPTFSGSDPYLYYTELGGATAQLVDVAPASATAAAELASHNTGSTGADAGVALIAGPINQPPAFMPIETDEQLRQQQRSSYSAPNNNGSSSLLARFQQMLRPIFTAPAQPRATVAVREVSNGNIPTSSETNKALSQTPAVKRSWAGYLNTTVGYSTTISPQIKAVRQLWRPVLAAFSTPRSYFNPFSLFERPAAAAEVPNARSVSAIKAKPALKQSAQDRPARNDQARDSQQRPSMPERPQRLPVRVLKSLLGETVVVGGTNGFTLPAGKSVQIMFSVTVNPSFPADTYQVCNAGTVSSTTASFSDVTTSPATCTTVCVTPQVTTPLNSPVVCEGTMATFTTTVKGNSPFTFVWKKNGSTISSGGRFNITTTTDSMAHTTTSTLTINPTILSDTDSYTADATSGACPSSISNQSATLTVNAAPTATAGPDQSVCGLVATLAGNTPSVGSGMWTKQSGPGTIIFGDASVPTTMATASVQGSYVLRWTTTNAGCTAFDEVTITYATPPTIANAGMDQTLCTTTPATLAANTPTSGTGVWSVFSGPSTLASQFSSTGAPNATFTPAGGAGTYVLQWTIGNAPCAASSDTVSIVYNAPPTMANAGPDQTLCTTTAAATLAANAPSSGAGVWSVFSGPSTLASQFSSTSAPNATFTPAGGAGTYVLQWTISNAPCTASSDTVNIVFNAPPTVSNAGPDQSLCTTAPTTLAANTPTSGTGVWSVFSGPSTLASQFSSTTSPTATFTPAGGAGTYVLQWTISNAPCTASSDTVNIVYNTPPTTANAGMDQTLCTTTPAMLAANTPSSGTGVWSVFSGPSTLASQFSNTSAPNATFTPAGGAGTYVLQWTISIASCPPSSDTVNIVYNAPPTMANAGPDQSLCTTTPATLAANSPSSGTGAWSVFSGPSTSAAQFSSTGAPNATFTPAGGAGTYVLQWTISNAPCAASSDTVSIVYNAPPTIANAGPDQTLCTTTAAATLAANTPTSGAGVWSVFSGPSTLASQFSSTTSPTATFTPAGGAGTYVLQWTISNAPCTASSDTVNIVFNAPPTVANAGPDQTLCTTTPATLAANSATSGTGVWSVFSGPSTLASQFSSTTSPTATFTPAGGAGTYVLQWTISNAPCAASSDTVSIVYNAPPTASNAGPDQTLCITTGSALLAANTASSGTGAWSVFSGPSTSTSQFSSTASPTATFTPAGGAGTYVLQWTISNAPCTASSDTVSIVFNAAPNAANAGSDQSNVCGLTATLAGNVASVGTGTWTKQSGPGTINFSNANSPTSTATASVTGTYNLRWTITNGSCTTFDEVTIAYDQIVPVITCPANQTNVPATTGQCSATVNPGTATATDNCGSSTITGTRSDSLALNAPYPVGTTTITWKATDAAGNMATCMQTITVKDTQAPVITCPANQVGVTNGVATTATVTVPNPTATDNCDASPTINCTRSDAQPFSNPVYPLGTTTITCTATDHASPTNTSLPCSFTVVVRTPRAAANNLKTLVQALVPGTLTQAQANTLNGFLELATTHLEQGNNPAACTDLANFVAQCNAFGPSPGSGPMNAAQRDSLISYANKIRNALGVCGGPFLPAKKAGIFAAQRGEFYLKQHLTTGLPDQVERYGEAGDLPVAGDWDGDKIDSLGIYRQGVFHLRPARLADADGNPVGEEITVEFGLPGDLPVVGDWDGDGVDTIGVYRQGQFLLRNSNRSGPPDIIINFGEAGDLPLAGDWDGDGQVTVGVYNPTLGLFKLSNTLKNVLADVVVQWGGPGYLPVVGDWDGDGIATIGLYGVAGEFLLRNTNTAGTPDLIFTLGVRGGLPVAGRWGDARAELDIR